MALEPDKPSEIHPDADILGPIYEAVGEFLALRLQELIDRDFFVPTVTPLRDLRAGGA